MTLIPTAPPVTPGRPVITAGSRELRVSWQAVEMAAVYEVWVGTTDSPGTAKLGAEVSGRETQAILTGLENEMYHYVWVRARNTAGTGEFSLSARAMPSAFAVPPPTPGTPTVIAGNAEILLSWQEVEGALLYEIWTATVNNLAEAEKHGSGVTGTEVTIGGLVNNVPRFFWVRAKNDAGTSGFSPVASGTPSVFAVVPSTPVAPTVTAGNRQITISWQTVEGVLSYEIWMATVNNPAEAEKHVYDVTDLSAVIDGLVNGTVYHVWVRAKNAIGLSGFSPPASGTPLGIPESPILTSYDRQLRITWTAVTGADEYDVFYGTTAAPTTLAVTTAETTVTITGLSVGTTYYVRLRARNSNNGISDLGPSANVIIERWSPGLWQNDERIGNQNLPQALEYISANAVNGDEFYIVLGADEAVFPFMLNYMGRTVSITLLGHGGERTLSMGFGGSMFDIRGVTFTLGENITLEGRSIDGNGNANNIAPLVQVNYGGTLIMNHGSRITGNTAIGSNSASGVRVAPGGTFKMIGGEVSGNTATGSNSASGVWVDSGGIFEISGGEISGNSGGTSVHIHGTFEMLGGEISENTGGVFIAGAFTMIGGEISENTGVNAGGVQVTSSGTFEMRGGNILGNTGSGAGGVRIDPGRTFEMSSGEISGNIATNWNGAGVHIASGSIFEMSGGNISGNTGNWAGGVQIAYGGTFEMSGGGISCNIGTNPGSAGGVFIDRGGTFEMSGGEISGNAAIFGTGSPTAGGVRNSGTFRISGGIIYGSDAEERLRNAATATGSFAALHNTDTAQFGIFNNGDFTPAGDLTSTNLTIEVRNGVLLRPLP